MRVLFYICIKGGAGASIFGNPENVDASHGKAPGPNYAEQVAGGNKIPHITTNEITVYGERWTNWEEFGYQAWYLQYGIPVWGSCARSADAFSQGNYVDGVLWYAYAFGEAYMFAYSLASRVAGTVAGNAGKAANQTITLTLRADITLSGGRSGQLVKNLTGPANSVVRGNGNRIFITNDAGQVIWDITKDRAKSVIPGQGFGPKVTPSQQQLDLLNKMWGN